MQDRTHGYATAARPHLSCRRRSSGRLDTDRRQTCVANSCSPKAAFNYDDETNKLRPQSMRWPINAALAALPFIVAPQKSTDVRKSEKYDALKMSMKLCSDDV